MDINTIISVAGTLLSIGVSWGIITTKLEGLQKEVTSMEEQLKDFTTKEACILKHEFVDRSLAEIKADVKEIKEILREMSRKPR